MARIWRIRLGVLAALLLGAVAFLYLTAKPLIQTKSSVAVTGCATLAKACEAYASHPANPKEELPRDLRDLLHPRFGEKGLLHDGANTLIDPWGKPYLMSISTCEDGSPYPLIWTVNTEGLLITQHGVGPRALPQREVQPKK